jgi:hypothetical protein
MADSVTHKAALMGQVIEDLSYEGIDPQRLRVELMGVAKPATYKDGGFFVFNDVRPGQYRVRIFGERLQPQEFNVVVPLAEGLLSQPGDDELVVVVKTASASDGKITFDPVVLRKAIRAGAAVRSQGFNTKLAARLEPGKVSTAKLESVQGLAAGAVLRLIRGRAVRLKFDPYFQTPPELTLIVGKVEQKNVPGLALPGVKIRLQKVNGVQVKSVLVAGANIATVDLVGKKVVLGTDGDIQAITNSKGDYNLYFSRSDITNVTLSANLQGYQTKNQNLALTQGGRNRADISLERS